MRNEQAAPIRKIPKREAGGTVMRRGDGIGGFAKKGHKRRP